MSIEPDFEALEALFGEPTPPKAWKDLGLRETYPYIEPRSIVGFMAIDLMIKKQELGEKIEVFSEPFSPPEFKRQHDARQEHHEVIADIGLFDFIVKSMKAGVAQLAKRGLVLDKDDGWIYEALADKIHQESIPHIDVLVPRSKEELQRLTALADRTKSAFVSDFGQHFKPTAA